MYYESFTYLRNQLQEADGYADVTVVCSDGRTRCSRLLLALTTQLFYTCLKDSEVDLLFLEDIKVDEFHMVINLLTGATIHVRPLTRDRIGELLDRLGFSYELDVDSTLTGKPAPPAPTVKQVCLFALVNRFYERFRLCSPNCIRGLVVRTL